MAGYDGGYGPGVDDDEESRVLLSSPAEVVAAAAVAVGFTPGAGSVVVFCGESATDGATPVMRLDAHGLLGLDPAGDPVDPMDPVDPDRPLDAGPAQFVADLCEREQIDSVHLVLVRPHCTRDADAADHTRDAAETFDVLLGMVGAHVEHALAVETFTEGEPWLDVHTGETGRQIDPRTSVLAARHAVDGVVLLETREEIEALYRERDPRAGTARRRRATPGLQGRFRHERAVLRAGEIGGVDDQTLARAGAALLATDVRDHVLSDLAGRRLEAVDGRRELWWAIARRRPDGERAAALVLLGAAAYFEGRGVHARAALDAALESDPGNRLALLLRGGIDVGMRPEAVRRAAS